MVGILDNQIDFATYDRWTSRELFQHNYAPDGVVDLFVIVWRNLVKDLVANTPFRSGLEARGFGVKSAAGLAVNPVPGNEMPRLLPVDNGARSIYTEWAPYAANGFWQPYGASIHMMNWLSDVGGALVHTRSNGIFDGVFRELIHEIGHHLHGHHRQTGTWSVLSVSDSRSYAMSAAELIDLGWIEPVIIRKSGTVPENIQLGDLYTTGQVLAVEVESLTNPLNVDKSTPEGLYNAFEGSKWYYVENHQMISPYDFTIGRLPVWGSSESTARGASRGLYITYNEDQIGFARQHVQSASGEFMWNNDRNATFWGRSNFPVFERLEQTRSEGATHSEQIPLSTPRDFGGPIPLSMFPVYLTWQGGTAVEKQLYLGESLEDHHDVCHAPVWTPWSSPSSSYTRSGLLTNPIQSGISVVIESETSGVFDLKVANNFVPIGPPSAPIGLNYPSSVGICGTAASPINYSAAISWVANVEPDLAGYRIYRSPGVNTLGWELIEELPSSAESFEDSEIDNPFPPIPAWNYLARVWYRVVAIDNTSLESSHCGHEFSVNVDYLAGQPGQQEVLNLLPLNEVMIRELGGNLWPNPSNSWVNFEPKFDGDTHGESNVAILTVSGELVTSESFYWNSSRKVISVPVATLPHGVYVLHLRLGTALYTAHFIRE